MDPGICGQLRVKRQTDLIFELYADDFFIHGGDHLHSFRDGSHVRGADEGHRIVGVEDRDRRILHKACQLSAVGIAADRHRESSQMNLGVSLYFFREKDQTGAGTQYRQTVPDPLLQGFEEVELPQ